MEFSAGFEKKKVRPTPKKSRIFHAPLSQLEKKTAAPEKREDPRGPFFFSSRSPPLFCAPPPGRESKTPQPNSRAHQDNMASEGMQSVLTLVNRLQAAATTLGDVAGGDKSLPSLWDMLPSIVVIGGQVGRRVAVVVSGSESLLLLLPTPGTDIGRRSFFLLPPPLASPSSSCANGFFSFLALPLASISCARPPFLSSSFSPEKSALLGRVDVLEALRAREGSVVGPRTARERERECNEQRRRRFFFSPFASEQASLTTTRSCPRSSPRPEPRNRPPRAQARGATACASLEHERPREGRRERDRAC